MFIMSCTLILVRLIRWLLSDESIAHLIASFDEIVIDFIYGDNVDSIHGSDVPQVIIDGMRSIPPRPVRKSETLNIDTTRISVESFKTDGTTKKVLKISPK